MPLIRLLQALAALLAHVTGTAVHDLQRTQLGLDAIDRLRLALTPGAEPVRTTASLGVTTFGAHCASLDLLLSQADSAMYCAKTAGRNRVMPADVPGAS